MQESEMGWERKLETGRTAKLKVRVRESKVRRGRCLPGGAEGEKDKEQPGKATQGWRDEEQTKRGLVERGGAEGLAGQARPSLATAPAAWM